VGNKIHKKNKEDVPPEVEYFEDNPRREEHTIKKVQHKKESTLPNNHVTSAMDSVNSLSDRTAMLFGLRPVSRQIKRSQQQGVEESVVSYASSSAVGSLESFPFPERSPSAEEEKTSVSLLDGTDVELNIATASLGKSKGQHAPIVETRKDSLATSMAAAKKREMSPIFQTCRSETNFRKRNDDPTIKYPSLNETE